MTRTAPTFNLADQNDPTVQLGLTVKCGACKQPPGQYCVNTVNGEPLISVRRWIHSYRLDKLLKEES